MWQSSTKYVSQLADGGTKVLSSCTRESGHRRKLLAEEGSVEDIAKAADSLQEETKACRDTMAKITRITALTAKQAPTPSPATHV